MPRGGARPGAGRPQGARNKATRELQDLAREYTEDALETLSKICSKGQSEAARVAAAVALLDRGYGKPKQTAEVTGKDEAPLLGPSAREIIADRLEKMRARRNAEAGNRQGTNGATH